MARATEIFAGASIDRSASWTSLVLEDRHPLHGGMDVSVTADGDVFVLEVNAAKRARRFRSALSAAGLAELDSLVATHDPSRIVITDERNGIAGEARPRLTFVANGTTTRLAKWAGDPHPAFDALWRWLCEIGEALATTAEPTAYGVWTDRFESTEKPAAPTVIRPSQSLAPIIHRATVRVSTQPIGELLASPNGRHLFATHGKVWRGSLRATGRASLILRTESGVQCVPTKTGERTYVHDEGRAVIVHANGPAIDLQVVDASGDTIRQRIENPPERRGATLWGTWRVGPHHATLVVTDKTKVQYDEYDRETQPMIWRLIDLRSLAIVAESAEQGGIAAAMAAAKDPAPAKAASQRHAKLPKLHRVERSLTEGPTKKLTSLRVFTLATAAVELEVATQDAVEASPNHDELFAVSRDERLVVGRSAEGTLLVWDLASGAKLAAPGEHGRFESALFVGDDSREIVAGNAEGELVVFGVNVPRSSG